MQKVVLTAGLLVPCALAAARGLSVGTDLSAYGIWTYQAAQNRELGEFLQAYADRSAVGFNLYAWVSANIFRSFELYLGGIEALFIVPAFCAVRRFFKNREWLPYLVVLLVLYAISLNAMKQSIAIGFCFLAASYADKERPFAFFCAVLVGFLFHQTAVIGLAFYPLHKVVCKGGGPGFIQGRWRAFVIVAGFVTSLGLLFVFGSRLVVLLSQFKGSYAYQVQHLGMGRPITSMLVLALVYLIAWKMCKGENHDKEPGRLIRPVNASGSFVGQYDYFFVMAVLACVLMQLQVVSASLDRVGYYFLPFMGLFVGELYFHGNGTSKAVALMILTVLIAYFIYTFVYMGGNEIYPYVTAWGKVLP